MDVEREVVDLYRALLMRDRIGQTFEGTITALVGSGAYVTLLEPFVDVLVRFESMGPDRYEIADDELSVVGARSGDALALGDPIVVTIEDVAVLRRTVYARREVPEKVLAALEATGSRRYTEQTAAHCTTEALSHLDAIEASLLSPAPRVLLCGGEERGTWLLENNVASDHSFAFALSLSAETTGAIARVAMQPASAADEAADSEFTLPDFFDALLARRAIDRLARPGARLILQWL